MQLMLPEGEAGAGDHLEVNHLGRVVTLGGAARDKVVLAGARVRARPDGVGERCGAGEGRSWFPATRGTGYAAAASAASGHGRTC